MNVVSLPRLGINFFIVHKMCNLVNSSSRDLSLSLFFGVCISTGGGLTSELAVR